MLFCTGGGHLPSGEEKIQDLGHGQWFSDKVPFGYSYVSERNEILNSANIHGYHVAGIAAANGSEEERYISGVAPDAQVLAMQVYDAETGNGGFSDDIICAIEDSVKLGADIINMSLGQDCGFYEDDRYINRAVNRANEQGVFVAISAGNAGMSTDIYEDDGVSRAWASSRFTVPLPSKSMWMRRLSVSTILPSTVQVTSASRAVVVLLKYQAV